MCGRSLQIYSSRLLSLAGTLRLRRAEYNTQTARFQCIFLSFLITSPLCEKSNHSGHGAASNCEYCNYAVVQPLTRNQDTFAPPLHHKEASKPHPENHIISALPTASYPSIIFTAICSHTQIQLRVNAEKQDRKCDINTPFLLPTLAAVSSQHRSAKTS